MSHIESWLNYKPPYRGIGHQLSQMTEVHVCSFNEKTNLSKKLYLFNRFAFSLLMFLVFLWVTKSWTVVVVDGASKGNISGPIYIVNTPKESEAHLITGKGHFQEPLVAGLYYETLSNFVALQAAWCPNQDITPTLPDRVPHNSNLRERWWLLDANTAILIGFWAIFILA